jgi:hypothetical protein
MYLGIDDLLVNLSVILARDFLAPFRCHQLTKFMGYDSLDTMELAI